MGEKAGHVEWIVYTVYTNLCMKKAIQFINKPIVLIGTLITALAVILAKFFITKEQGSEDKKD